MRDMKTRPSTFTISTPRRRTRGVATLLVMGVGLVLLGGLYFAWMHLSPHTSTNGSVTPIKLVASAKQPKLKETAGRTNVMVLGSDRRANSTGSERADTILVASIGKLDHNVVLISVPRDLWVESPVCGRCKITEVYAYASKTGHPEEELKKVVENVLGIPIHYYGVVNFSLFEDIIDILGGVTVDVAQTFDDYTYPVEGKEADLCGHAPEEAERLLQASVAGESDDEDVPVMSIPEIFPCRYEHIHFDKGPQEMDGATALKYVRSRHGTNQEGTDFARSARQQKIIMAIKNKVLSLDTLLNPKKLQELYSLYKDTVRTDVDLVTLQNFYRLMKDVSFDEIKTVVFDDRSSAEDGGLLYSPVDRSLYGGKYVLLPKAGDYSQIHAYVQRFLFGD